jgi:hypothetical protein
MYQNDTLDFKKKLLFWSTIKERNTWQVRSTSLGKIRSVADSNSIVGDISYYKFDPRNKIIASFTTYSASGYLKSMCNEVFRRFTSASDKFELEYLADNNEIDTINNWKYFSKISLKLDIKNFANAEDEKPELINAILGLGNSFGGGEISISLNAQEASLPKNNIIETINYLSENNACPSLCLSGGNEPRKEKIISVDLKKAFVEYRTKIYLNPAKSFIEPKIANSVLSDAFASINK